MTELFSGDERGWTKVQLEAWIAAANEGFTSGMGWDWGAAIPSTGRSEADLLKEVSTRLDELYNAFEPKFIVPLEGVDVSQLPPWAPLPVRMLPCLEPACTRDALRRLEQQLWPAACPVSLASFLCACCPTQDVLNMEERFKTEFPQVGA